MDIALLKKMHVYPSDAALSELVSEADSEHSTLIKADISYFHEAPPAIDILSEDQPLPVSDYDLGFQQGQEKAEAVYQDTIKVMQAALDSLQAEMASVTQQIEAGHLSVVSECLRAVFPALMRGGTDLELQTLLKNACGGTLKGHIHLYVHPDDEAHCEQLCEGKGIDIVADATLAPLQMRLKWENGGADIGCQSAAEFCLRHLEAALPEQ